MLIGMPNQISAVPGGEQTRNSVTVASVQSNCLWWLSVRRTIMQRGEKCCHLRQYTEDIPVAKALKMYIYLRNPVLTARHGLRFACGFRFGFCLLDIVENNEPQPP